MVKIIKEETKIRKKANNKAYYLLHREKANANSKTYRQVHLEECKASAKAWYLSHKKERAAYSKAYYLMHKEERAARDKVYQRSLTGKAVFRKHRAKRRQLGFISLNAPFKDSEGHHMDTEHVVYIPKELHRGNIHSLLGNRNMEMINTLALNFLKEKNEGILIGRENLIRIET